MTAASTEIFIDPLQVNIQCVGAGLSGAGLNPVGKVMRRYATARLVASAMPAVLRGVKRLGRHASSCARRVVSRSAAPAPRPRAAASATIASALHSPSAPPWPLQRGVTDASRLQSGYPSRERCCAALGSRPR